MFKLKYRKHGPGAKFHLGKDATGAGQWKVYDKNDWIDYSILNITNKEKLTKTLKTIKEKMNENNQ